MKPTRTRTLLAVAAVCAAVAWLAVRATFASLPRLPWTTAPLLLLLAFGEWWMGRNLRDRMRDPGSGKPIDAIAVARTAALARASSAAAAAFGGLALGFLIYVGGYLDKAIPRADALVATVTLASAAALAAAALYLEHCCRAPRPPDDADDDLPSARGWPDER
jgi:hypothetical protein